MICTTTISVRCSTICMKHFSHRQKGWTNHPSFTNIILIISEVPTNIVIILILINTWSTTWVRIRMKLSLISWRWLFYWSVQLPVSKRILQGWLYRVFRLMHQQGRIQSFHNCIRLIFFRNSSNWYGFLRNHKDVF